MSLIHNERTKLTATWINSVASGVTITGGAAPIVAAVLGMSGVAQVGLVALAASSVIWLFVGISLHLTARAVLGRLRQ